MTNDSQPSPQPEVALDDGIIRLRPLTAADSEITRAWRNDPAVWARTMGFRLPITESMELHWYDHLAADNGLTRIVFGIERLASGARPDELVGFVQINEIDWPSRTASFGIIIGPVADRRAGLGRRSLRLATGYAARSLHLRKLTLKVVAFNVEAHHLYESEGWITEGRQIAQFTVDGTDHDVILMARFLQDRGSA